MKNTIFLRAVFRLNDHYVKRGDLITVELKEPKVAVSVRRADETSEAKILVEATMTRNASDTTAVALRSEAAGEWPEGSVREQRLHLNAEASDRPQFVELPEGLQTFCTQVHVAMGETARQVVAMLRWRNGTYGGTTAMSIMSCEWSDDGVTWHVLPARITGRTWASPGIYLTPEAQADLIELANTMAIEPVSRELLREAEDLLKHGNPRAALMIAVAALENAVKETISCLAPDATWLVRNLPSPPIERLLIDYLPKLPIKREHIALGETMVGLVKDAVSARNRLVHVGSTVEYDFVRRVVDGFGHILYLLDAYCGHSWAVEYFDEAVLSGDKDPSETIRG